MSRIGAISKNFNNLNIQVLKQRELNDLSQDLSQAEEEQDKEEEFRLRHKNKYTQKMYAFFKSENNTMTKMEQLEQTINKSRNMLKKNDKPTVLDHLKKLLKIDFKIKVDQQENEFLFRIHDQKIQLCNYSLGFISAKSKFRQRIVWFIYWDYFNGAILIFIVLNSVSLAFYDYSDRDNETSSNQKIELIQYGFSVVFFFECLLKIIGQGFVRHKNAYLKNKWNIMDFIIVLVSFMDFFPNLINLKILRVLRVLKPLKSINAVPSMRILVSTLFQSLPKLANVAVFLVFNLTLFAILGTQQYSGKVYSRCRLTEFPVNDTYWPKDEDNLRVCSKTNKGFYQCPEDQWCGSPLEYGISREDDGVYTNANIQFGINNFDNIIQAFLGIIQMITCDSWTVIMYNFMDADGLTFSSIYCCLIIIFCSFFLVNLILAVIMESFVQIYQEQVDLAKAETQIKNEEFEKKQKIMQEAQKARLEQSRMNGETTSSRGTGGLLTVLARHLNRDVLAKLKKKEKEKMELVMQKKKARIQRQKALKKKKLTEEEQQMEEQQQKEFKMSLKELATILRNEKRRLERQRNAAMIRLKEVIQQAQRQKKQLEKKQQQAQGNLAQILQMGRLKKVQEQAQKELAKQLDLALAAKREETQRQLGQMLARAKYEKEHQEHIALARVLEKAKKAKQGQQELAQILQKQKKLKKAEEETKESCKLLAQNLQKAKVMKNQAKAQHHLAELLQQKKDEKILNQRIHDNPMQVLIETLKKEKVNKRASEATKELALRLHQLKEINLQIKEHTPQKLLGQMLDKCKREKKQKEASLKLGSLLAFAKKEKQIQQRDETGGMPGLDLGGLFGGGAKAGGSSQKNENPLAMMFGGLNAKKAENKLYIDQMKAKIDRAEELTSIDEKVIAYKELFEENKNKLENVKLKLAEKINDSIQDQYGTSDENEKFKIHLTENSKFLEQIALEEDIIQQNIHMSKVEGIIKEQILKKQIFEGLSNKFGGLFDEKKGIEELNEQLRDTIFTNNLEKRAQGKFYYQIPYHIIQTKKFEGFIMACILANTVALGMEKYPSSPRYDAILEKINEFFFWSFLFEMIFKMLGLGFHIYFQDSSNTFDCVIVNISIVDLIVNSLNTNISTSALTSLRVLRLLRIFKLAKIWKSFSKLMKTIISTIKELSSFAVFLSLFIYIYAMIGMELFAHKVRFNDDNVNDLEDGYIIPDFTFDSLIYAIESVFIVLANDGWSTIYFDHYRAGYHFSSTVFFYSLLLIGQYVILNLFFATLLQNFEEDSLQSETEKQELEKKKELMKQKQKEEHERVLMQITLGLQVMGGKSGGSILIQSDNKKKEPKDRSLFLFSKDNKFRNYLTDLRLDPKFDNFFSLMIVLNSIALAIDNPLYDPESPLMRVLNVLDHTFNVLFLIEALILIISKGFLFNGEGSYLRNSWNILDFIVVLISGLLTFQSYLFKGNIDFLRTLRLLRILRPLKMIKRNKGLQICVMSLISAIPNLLNITAISFIVLLIFSIVGISYMKGKMFYCDDSFIGNDFPPILTKWECYSAGGVWINYIANFDNVFEGMQALLQMTATVGWAAFMTQGMKVTEIDYSPIQNNSPFLCFFFMFFILCGSMFIGNLFVCIVISAFNREKDLLSNDFLNEDNNKIENMKLINVNAKPVKKPPRPEQAWRLPFNRLALSPTFNNGVIFSCILINTIALCVKYYDMQPGVEAFLSHVNNFFTVVFAIEAIIKLIGLGKYYFREGWNRFDFTIVLLSCSFVIYGLISGEKLESGVVINALRICRVFKLLKKFPKIQILYHTIIASLPQLANVGALLALFLFLFTVLGVNMFATIKFSGNMSEHLNFQSFFFGIITLLRATTGENWHDLLTLLSKKNQITYQCIENPTYQDYVDADYNTVGCGNYVFTVIYFNLFYLFGSMIFLNLFIGIVLQGFSDTSKGKSKLLDDAVTEQFVRSWSNFDPFAEGFLHKHDLVEFMYECGHDMGLDHIYRSNRKAQEIFFQNLGFKIFKDKKRDDQYSFDNVYEVLAMRYVVLQEVRSIQKKLDIKKTQEESFQREPEFTNMQLSVIQQPFKLSEIKSAINIVMETVHSTVMKPKTEIVFKKYLKDSDSTDDINNNQISSRQKTIKTEIIDKAPPMIKVSSVGRSSTLQSQDQIKTFNNIKVADMTNSSDDKLVKNKSINSFQNQMSFDNQQTKTQDKSDPIKKPVMVNSYTDMNQDQMEFAKEIKQLNHSLHVVEEEEKQDLVQDIESESVIVIQDQRPSKRKTKNNIQSIHVSSLESSVDEQQLNNNNKDEELTQFNDRDESSQMLQQQDIQPTSKQQSQQNRVQITKPLQKQQSQKNSVPPIKNVAQVQQIQQQPLNQDLGINESNTQQANKNAFAKKSKMQSPKLVQPQQQMVMSHDNRVAEQSTDQLDIKIPVYRNMQDLMNNRPSSQIEGFNQFMQNRSITQFQKSNQQINQDISNQMRQQRYIQQSGYTDQQAIPGMYSPMSQVSLNKIHLSPKSQTSMIQSQRVPEQQVQDAMYSPLVGQSNQPVSRLHNNQTQFIKKIGPASPTSGGVIGTQRVKSKLQGTSQDQQTSPSKSHRYKSAASQPNLIMSRTNQFAADNLQGQQPQPLMVNNFNMSNNNFVHSPSNQSDKQETAQFSSTYNSQSQLFSGIQSHEDLQTQNDNQRASRSRSRPKKNLKSIVLDGTSTTQELQHKLFQRTLLSAKRGSQGEASQTQMSVLTNMQSSQQMMRTVGQQQQQNSKKQRNRQRNNAQMQQNTVYITQQQQQYMQQFDEC